MAYIVEFTCFNPFCVYIRAFTKRKYAALVLRDDGG